MSLVAEGACQATELDEQTLDRQAEPDLERRRIGVVRALATVRVIVWIEIAVIGLRTSSQFETTIDDDLVHVHVGGRAGAALHDVHDELVVEPPFLDLLAGAVEKVGLPAIERTDFGIGARGGLLDARIAEDQVGVLGDRPSADGEIVESPADVDAPVRIGRYLL